MISIEILNCKNDKRQGEYKFYKDLLNLGSDTECDLFIDEDNFRPYHSSIFIHDYKLYLEIHNTEDHALVNGKRSNAKKVIQIGDVITLNTTKFKIKSFLNEQKTRRKEFLNKRVDEISVNDSSLTDILQKASGLDE